MQDNDASRIIAVVDNRIKRNTGSMAKTETTWGEVCAVSADGKYASAYLYGDTENASEDFRVPMDLAVNVGDSVKVAWNDRGERWVYDLAIPTAYKKLAINPVTGEILTGDGTVPPQPVALGASYEPLGAAAAAVGGHEGASNPHPGYATDSDLSTGLATKASTDHSASHAVGGSDSLSAEAIAVASLQIGANVFLTASGVALQLAGGNILQADGLGIGIRKTTTQSTSTITQKVTSWSVTDRTGFGCTFEPAGAAFSQVRIDVAGWWLVIGQVVFDTNATGRRVVGISVGTNGGDPGTNVPNENFDVRQASSVGNTNSIVALLRYFNVNDTVALCCSNSAGALNLVGAVLTLARIGR